MAVLYASSKEADKGDKYSVWLTGSYIFLFLLVCFYIFLDLEKIIEKEF